MIAFALVYRHQDLKVCRILDQTFSIEGGQVDILDERISGIRRIHGSIGHPGYKLIGTHRAERDAAVSWGNARDVDAGDPRVRGRCRGDQREGTQRYKTTWAQPKSMSTSSHGFPPNICLRTATVRPDCAPEPGTIGAPIRRHPHRRWNICQSVRA